MEHGLEGELAERPLHRSTMGIWLVGAVEMTGQYCHVTHKERKQGVQRHVDETS
jgi:hypothetical protein